MLDLRGSKGFILDMDGTFFLGDQLLPGALELLELFNRKGLPFYFLTNNSSHGRGDYVKKLVGFGVRAGDARVFTSGDATIGFLQQNYPGSSVFLMGTESLETDFRSSRIKLADEAPEVLVLGYDTSLTYKKLCKFCGFVRQGLPYLATHPDINFPTSNGLIPDIGAIMALVQASTGRTADKIFGKPDRNIIVQLAIRMGVAPENLVMVGDRLYTDIALGTTAGMTTVLVLSGETKVEDLQETPYKPDYVCRDLADLVSLLG
ncbi:MAG: HAD-IIA family hydrolase [Anaerolineaceae bacterium]